MSSETRGKLLVLLTAIISGFSIIANRFFVLNVDPVLLTAVRALVIGSVFLVVTLVNDRGRQPVSLPSLLFIGLIGGGLAFWMFYTALAMTLGGRAAFIHKTLPVWATVLAIIFLREKLSRKQVAAMLVALSGLLVMNWGSLPAGMRAGDLLALGATILWAAENTVAKKVMSEGESNWRVTFSRMFIGSLFLFSVAAFQGKLPQLLALQPVQWAYIGISTALLLGYVLTWYWGLRYLPLFQASTILLLSPVLSMVFGMLLLGEPVFVGQAAGSALILLGCYLLIRVKGGDRSGKPETAA
ncbi:MAG TPA: hypothetical protein ENN60_03755 [archaeon]|nr:hypothetical protein [archaeon]